MALILQVKEVIWLKGFCKKLGYNQDSVRIHYDSQSAIYLAKNAVHIKGISTWIQSLISSGI